MVPQHDCWLQVPFDATVRISLDTNLAMIKENVDGQPVGLMHRSCLFDALYAVPSRLPLVPISVQAQQECLHVTITCSAVSI